MHVDHTFQGASQEQSSRCQEGSRDRPILREHHSNGGRHIRLPFDGAMTGSAQAVVGLLTLALQIVSESRDCPLGFFGMFWYKLLSAGMVEDDAREAR
jgi:hypothetical protein